MLSSLSPTRKMLISSLTVALGLLLSGCDSDNQSPSTESKGQAEPQLPPLVDTPYSVWPSARTITGKELGGLIKQNENAATELCQSDANRPAGYTQHLALVSTPSFDRADAADRYKLDPSLPVSFGNTGRMLAPNLGDFLAQKGGVDPNDSTGRDAIKLTFSKDGRFTDLCESGYTNVVNIVSDDGKMTTFSTACHQEAVVVCMSVK